MKEIIITSTDKQQQKLLLDRSQPCEWVIVSKEEECF